MKYLLTLIIILQVQMIFANELTGKRTGYGEKIGSLGSYLASCSAAYEANFEEWQTRFTIQTLQFECNDGAHILFPKMIFDVKNNQAISDDITGTVSDGLAHFIFPLTSNSEYRVKIHAKKNGIFIQVSLMGGVGLIYSFEALL